MGLPIASLVLMIAALMTSPNPVPSPRPSPSPSPSASPAPFEIGHTSAGGRAANLVGSANAASEGTIDQDQIAARPVLRPGEVLEDIPGLVISQHSGEGKANQYYLRGFQLDHGTDLAGTIAGIPVNMPTHAHGQAYSDINWVMPELVSFVTYKKGPYAVDEGDFSTAGAYDMYYRDTIAPTASLGFGTDGYDRLFVADSPRVGAGHLLYAVELYHDDGPFVNPDDYKKPNAVLRWSRQGASTNFNVSAWAYRGDFNSTDQIPQRLVDAGLLNRFGAVDPTDGGRTYRYALSTEYTHQDPNGVTSFNAFGESYGLDLFSNFTYDEFGANDYYNVNYNPLTCSTVHTTCVPSAQHVNSYVSYCPANETPTGGSTTPGSVTPAAFGFHCGDQREQEDKRFITGFTLKRDLVTGNAVTEFGAGLRNDNIYVLGLYLTQDQVRFANGTLSNDDVVERDVYAWGSTTYHAGRKLRLVGGLRFDTLSDDVRSFLAANSGTSAEGMLNPKFTSAYAFSPHQEAYLNFGDSFHSNDGRGTTQTVDPQTRTTFDPTGAPVQNYSPLVRAWGEEAGYRYSAPQYTATISFWKLNIASELVFDGDHGVTTPNGPTVRKGIEFTNYWRPFRGWTISADVATSTARFLTNPDNLGTFVPESLNVVTSAGVSTDRPTYAASVDLRYFGPRVLDQAGDAVSAPSSLVDLQVIAKLHHGARLRLDVFNLLNAVSDDVEYAYQSWLPSDAANPANAALNPAYPNACQTNGNGCGVNDYHFHPSDNRQVRLTLAVPFR
jgi:hypothetical protein